MKRPSLPRRLAWTARLSAEAPLEARFPFRSAEAIRRAQRRRLRETVEHAFEHVPYYRETGRRLGLSAADFEHASDLAKLPLIERDQLQADPEYFVSRAEPLDQYLELHTGGSTGEPITFFRHRSSLYERMLSFQRAAPVNAKLTGKRWRRRIAMIAPTASSTTDVNRAVGRQRLGRGLRTVVRTIPLFDPLPEIAAQIEEFRPDVVSAYGSAIEALYSHLAAAGRDFYRPSLVVYAADSLSDQVRRLLSGLGIEVLSVYQAVETPTIAWECDAHSGLHQNLDICPVRIVDGEAKELPAGESGSVVVSNLVSRATMLLNYALGDLATKLPEPCPCGRALPLLSQPEGRTSEWMLSRSGRPIHPQTMRSILRHLDEIRRYQLIQERPGEVRVVIVAAPDADRRGVAEAIAARAGALPDPLDARVEFSETLSRTESGKVRTILNAGTGG